MKIVRQALVQETPPTNLALWNKVRSATLTVKFSAGLLSIMLFFIFCLVSGCSSKQNYAPVRSYNQDFLKSNKLYQVKPGDTLYSIGFRSGLGYQKLAKWNNISPPYKLLIGQKIKLFQAKKLAKKASRRPEKVGKLTKVRTSSQKKIIKKVTISYNNQKLLKLYWQWPIKGKILKNFSQTGRKGLDISGFKGQKIKSAASGKVVYSGDGLKGYGNLLIIKHNYLYLSAYANNRRLLVKEGQRIKKGQIIAEVGQVKGKKTSLHFEIRKNGKPVDPINYLPKN